MTRIQGQAYDETSHTARGRPELKFEAESSMPADYGDSRNSRVIAVQAPAEAGYYEPATRKSGEPQHST